MNEDEMALNTGGGHPSGYVAAMLERLARSGLSDAELCRRAGLAGTTMMRIKSGRSSPTIRTMDKILGVLERHEAALQREKQ